jgi:formate hydrogenlyase subunit 3/multisubunit Na+/H+ antiporter MnhD subunit
MNFSSEFLILGALVPLAAGVALQLALGRWLGARAKGVLALACALPSVAAVVAGFVQVRATGALDWTALNWDGPLKLVFHVDALSLMFAAMGTVLGAAVLLYSIGYMAEERGTTRFYSFMLTFIAGMVGLVYSANLFALYLSWEAMGLCSFSLVGFWYTRTEAVAGARKVLLMTHLAGYGLLAAILIIYARTDSALWTDPKVAQAFTGGVFTLMLVALLAKSVQFPLHTWIGEAMNAPTPVSALLHAACYVKAGVYLAARMHSFGPWEPSWSTVVLWLGTVTMVVGVMYAMVQHDLKRMLAFHTVSQIGYIITGIGLGTPLGIAAGLLHCLNHSLFKGGLFLAAGSVQHATGTRDMNLLGGLARKMPRTTIVWLISVGSMMGVPFMSGFASKWLLYTAALQAGQVVPALAAWVVSVGTVFSCVKATSTVFLGPTTEHSEHAHEAPLTMQIALGLFAAGSVVLGLAPQLAVNYILNPILAVLGMTAVEVSWFGLTPAVGSMWTTGGLVLAVVSALFGAMLFAFAGMSRMRTVALAGGTAGGGVSVFTGGERLNGPSRLPASEFSKILKKSWMPLFRATNVDGVYLAVWSVLEGASQLAGLVLAWVERPAITWTLILTGAAAVAVHGFVPADMSRMYGVAETMPTLLGAGYASAGALLLLVAAAHRASRRRLPLLAVSVAAAVSAALVTGAWKRLALVELATAAAVALVWQTATRRAAWLYTAVAAASAALLISGQVALMQGADSTARTLLMAGFVLKLGLGPLLLWLPTVVEEIPALVSGLIIAVVDIAAFGELVGLTQAHPELVAPRGLWIGVALFTSLAAALMMLAEKNIKRLLALSTIEDVGFLLLGLAAVNAVGIEGAIAGATVHALAKTLLFIALSAPEADGALKGEPRGLAARYPVSAAAFLAGMLAMLGVPPLMGFVGRWRLYATALEVSPWVMGGFIAASMMALIGYVLCLTRSWWGPAESDAPEPAHEPWLVRVAMVVPVAMLLAGGLWPDALAALVARLG